MSRWSIKRRCKQMTRDKHLGECPDVEEEHEQGGVSKVPEAGGSGVKETERENGLQENSRPCSTHSVLRQAFNSG